MLFLVRLVTQEYLEKKSNVSSKLELFCKLKEFKVSGLSGQYIV